jgi:hypothetical protein
MPRLHCCWIGRNGEECEDAASWELWDGIQPYFDHYVHACTEHVGALLTDSPEHRVYRLDSGAFDVPHHSHPGEPVREPSSSTAPRADALVEIERLVGRLLTEAVDYGRASVLGHATLASPTRIESEIVQRIRALAAPAPRQPSEPVAVAPVECRAGIDYWQASARAARQPSDTDTARPVFCAGCKRQVPGVLHSTMPVYCDVCSQPSEDVGAGPPSPSSPSSTTPTETP